MRLPHSHRLSLLIALAALSASASAQSGTEVVSFSVSAINLVAFFGAPSLTINTALPGVAPTSANNSVGTWAVTTNQSLAKITARIPANVQAGITLSVNLTAPAGGSASAGFRPLSTVSVDVVTGLTRVTQAGMAVAYRLDATPAAGVIASTTRVVTYTITGGT